MAKEISYFFDSKSGDRKYSAGDFSTAFAAIFGDGVILSSPDSLLVSADGTGRSVKVAYGGAVIKGRIYILRDNSTGQLTITVPAGIANGSTALIVARFSNTTDDASRLINIKAVATRSTAESEYDLVLAQVLVSNNIPDGAVTDTRSDATLCGIVSVAGMALQDFVDAYGEFVATLAGATPVLQAHVANDISSLPTDTETIKYVIGVGAAAALKALIDAKQAAITGAASSIVSNNLSASRALISDGSGKVGAAAVTATELGYLSGVTGAVQGQINAKQASISGAASSIASTNLTQSRALVSDAAGKVGASDITAAELAHLSGVTSAIQAQINAKLSSSRIKVAETEPEDLQVGDYWFKDLGLIEA